MAKLVVEEGRKMTQLSYELDIPYGTMSRWVSEYRSTLKQPEGKEEYLTPKELKKQEDLLRKEIQELKDENEILKKAMHIFTKNLE